jgi:putative transposase
LAKGVVFLNWKCVMQLIDPITGKVIHRKRRRRFDEPFSARELTFSCYRKYPFFSKDRARRWFVDALQQTRSDWPVDIWAWVLMPDHVHLIVSPRTGGLEIGRFQGRLKERVARQAVAWLEECAPEWLERITVVEGTRRRRRFWQPGGGYDRNICETHTLLSMIDYLHHNPVRRGPVQRAVDWAWSSARFYAGMESVEIEMDRTLPLIIE